ncbi:UN93B protein, partial [Anseranas semipalmata]|nr:UN93B protein [Anseranas semipalmata]
MENGPGSCQDAAKAAAGEGPEVQLDEVVGTPPDYNEEEEEQKYFRRKRLGVVKNVLAASLAATLTYGVYLGLLQMQLILHYDETYREVKYSNMELEDIDRKVLMGINVTPVAALLYTPVLIRFFGTKWTMFLAVGIYALFVSSNYWERYFTLVPSAVAIGVAIVPLWASMGNYVTRRGCACPAGTLSHGTLPGFNKTVLHSLPRSVNLIVVESVLMAAAFLAMLVVLLLCGSAYRPTEEIDLRSIGWGNIFQLPFKHMRDYRLRHLLPFFIYSGFEVLFVCTGFSLNYGVCALGLEKLAYLLMAYGFSASACSSLALCTLRLQRQCPLLAGALVHAAVLVTLFCWAPEPRRVVQAPLLYAIAVLWGLGSALNKTGISILLGVLYEDKERQDFVFTIYHWWQALAIFTVYLWSGLPMKAKLSIMLLALGLAVGSYLWMERKLARRVSYRLPRIPRPCHKVRGYRYLEEDDSDETASEDEGASGSDGRQPVEAGSGDELPGDEGERR